MSGTIQQLTGNEYDCKQYLYEGGIRVVAEERTIVTKLNETKTMYDGDAVSPIKSIFSGKLKF